MNMYKMYSNTYRNYGNGQVVLRVSVEYATSTDDIVGDGDIEKLFSLEVVARTNSEYISFFKEIETMMSKQCNCPAGADDFHIQLCPVFKVTVYRDEEEFNKNDPRCYSFVNFYPKFYKRVVNLLRTSH
jgi:hypothetical protein